MRKYEDLERVYERTIYRERMPGQDLQVRKEVYIAMYLSHLYKLPNPWEASFPYVLAEKVLKHYDEEDQLKIIACFEYTVNMVFRATKEKNDGE